MAFTVDFAGPSDLALRGSGIPFVASDTAADDSDKTLAGSSVTTETSRAILIVGVRVELTATATAGTRTIELQMLNGSSDVVWSTPTSTGSNVTATNTITAELSPRESATAAIAGVTFERLPFDLWMDSGHSLRVFDSAAVDATADDMIVHIRGVLH